MALKGKMLGVSIPDTVLEERSSLREKTAKLGLIARACAVYGVDEVEVFPDKGGEGEAELIVTVLRFLETPQYLRKRLFPMDPNLQFAGLLPPLRIPSHRPKTNLGEVKVGDVREGVANGEGTADVGLGAPVRLEGSAKAGARVTVRVTGTSPLVGETVARGTLREYWGYSVERKKVEEVFADGRFGVKVATSRKGDPLASRIGDLRRSVDGGSGVKLIFGSPSRGLFEIVEESLLEKADYVLNIFVEQHVETVRSEEAIFAGLNLVNVVLSEKA